MTDVRLGEKPVVPVLENPSGEYKIFGSDGKLMGMVVGEVVDATFVVKSFGEVDPANPSKTLPPQRLQNDRGDANLTFGLNAPEGSVDFSQVMQDVRGQVKPVDIQVGKSKVDGNDVSISFTAGKVNQQSFELRGQMVGKKGTNRQIVIKEMFAKTADGDRPVPLAESSASGVGNDGLILREKDLEKPAQLIDALQSKPANSDRNPFQEAIMKFSSQPGNSAVASLLELIKGLSFSKLEMASNFTGANLGDFSPKAGGKGGKGPAEIA